MMNKIFGRQLLVVLLSALFLTACQSESSAMAAAIEGRGALAVQEQGTVETVESWLECDDCQDGELDAVLKLGDEALPLLLVYLEAGPREERLRLLDTSLRGSYAELSEYAKIKEDRRLIPQQSQEEFVFFFSENFVSQYQTRSAIAIQQIGDEEAIEKARQLLEEALAVTEREDLRAKLVLALEQLK